MSTTTFGNIGAVWGGASGYSLLTAPLSSTRPSTWADAISSSLHHMEKQQSEQEPHLLEQLIRLYTAYMANDVRSPVPHLAGPPGVGKSESVEQLAELVGKQLHVINVSRISPLEIEGIQMPSGTGDALHLKLLHNPLWTSLKDGDIVLLDEFLRGFPEVYNGLLDILTSRHVAGFDLPKVFFVAASNSVTAYDAALEDRLLHLFVPDIRRGNSRGRAKIKEILVKRLGLMPRVQGSPEMDQLIVSEIEPMYEILDMFKHKKRAGSTKLSGHSVRNLIGQAQLRQVQSPALKDLLSLNNQYAAQEQKYQFYLYYQGKVPDHVHAGIKTLVGNPRLTPVQQGNVALNLALIEMFDENQPEVLTEEVQDDTFI